MTLKSDDYLTGYFYPKYMRFQVQKYRRIIFHDTEQ